MTFSIQQHIGKKIVTILLLTQAATSSCSANTEKNNSTMVDSKRMECKMTPVKKSKAAIEAILNDLDSVYSEVGGGGISEIKQTRTDVYLVSIPQEERIDQFTYEISVDDMCKVKILKKEPSTITPAIKSNIRVREKLN